MTVQTSPVVPRQKRAYLLSEQGREKLRAAMNRPEVREKLRAAASERMKRIHQLAKAMAAMTNAG